MRWVHIRMINTSTTLLTTDTKDISLKYRDRLSVISNKH